MITQAIQDHIARFQLISNHETWLDSYENVRELYSDPAIDKVDNAEAILQSTFDALSAANQLRIKRFSGYTGLGYERKWYNEIQILDQHNQVVETIVGSVEGNDIPTTKGLITYLRSPERYEEGVRIIYNLTETILVLPIELPNYPEFRDENGNPLEGWCTERSYGSFYTVTIVIDDEFITEEVVTEEMQQGKNRTIQQCKNIKEELMMNRWHPSRVERLLLAGYDVEDM
jgi:hypothetical protein